MKKIILSFPILLFTFCSEQNKVEKQYQQVLDSIANTIPNNCEIKDPEIDSFNITSTSSSPGEENIPAEFKTENGKLNVVFTKWMNGANDRILYDSFPNDTLYMSMYISDCIAISNVHAKRVYVRFKHMNRIPKQLKVNGTYGN